jgi:hypothetical protein
MTANALHTDRLGPGLRQVHNIVRVSSPHKNCFAVAANPQSRLRPSLLPRTLPRVVGSENAHPGPAVWVPVLILFALSVAAYLLFMAKATCAWPFGQ